MSPGIKSIVRHDLPASVVVFLVALPLCMGIAIASGVSPAAGLITGIVGGLIVGVFSGSPLQVSGPAAGLAVIVYEFIQKFGIEMLGPIVLLAGIFQVLAAILRMGQWFRAVAPPVVFGMLAGIGVLIFASQFHVMVDDTPKGSGIENLLSIPSAIVKGVTFSPHTNHHWAALIGACTILVIVLWTNFRPEKLRAIPAPLLGAIGGLSLALATGVPVQRVDVPDNLFSTVTWPTIEQLSRYADLEVLGTGLAVAMVASAETLLCAIAVDRMQDRVKTQFNRELGAQGIGNALCGLFGALPMTGVIVRSSANVDSGARTRASAILHGVWLLAFVALLPMVLRLIPTASLAAILVYTGYKLVNPANIKELKQYGWSSIAIYSATIVGIVATDLLKGVLIGIVLSVLRLLYRLSHLSADVKRAPDGKRVDIHLRGAVTFLGIPKLARTLESASAADDVRVHIEGVSYIDHAALVTLSDWEKQRRARGARVALEWAVLDERSEKVRRGPADNGNSIRPGLAASTRPSGP